jgi:hypothetical protein
MFNRIISTFVFKQFHMEGVEAHWGEKKLFIIYTQTFFMGSQRELLIN